MSAVTVSIDQSIATVTLNRPDSLNALDFALAEGLNSALNDIARNDSVRCVVLTGSGGHFMAGGDIAFFKRVLDSEDNARETISPLFKHVHGSIETLRGMPQPVIARVQGACAGFGVSLMSACDLAVAAEGSVFTLAYCHLGVSPDGGSTWSLPRIVGLKRANELMLLGDRFDATAAFQYGLINRVVEPEELDATVQQLARRLASGPAKAYARGKALMQQSLQTPLTEQLDTERDFFLQCTEEADFAEGVNAFLEKRRPEFGN
ncbi:MAG: enoyl-CoA hydratase [Pseudomonadota bacterium]